MPEPIVQVEALTKTFVHMGRPLEVLRGIDLRIDQGEVLAIVGTSGAGKSTLLHCIGTLDTPTQGKIRIGKEEITGLSSKRLAAIRNRSIGFVFQFHHLLPEFTAIENVMMPGLIQGRSQSEMRGHVEGLLVEVGLVKRGTYRFGELLGGEQQRVALARALVLFPKLILADEPTGNLDSKTGADIQALFFDMNRKHGTTIIVVTHDRSFAESMPRVVSMKDGLVERDTRNTAIPSFASLKEQGAKLEEKAAESAPEPAAASDA
jgi:lipoprotein-releasing system ATP-binding protein